MVGKIGDGHVRSAQHQRGDDQQAGHAVQAAAAPERHVEQADRPRQHHRREHDGADDVGIVFAAQFGRRQILWKVKRQHAQEAQRGQEKRQRAAGQAVAAFQLAALLEQVGRVGHGVRHIVERCARRLREYLHECNL